MNSYILFIYGMFDDVQDIEYYCNEVLLKNEAVNSLKFVVENSKNLIIVLDSDKGIDFLTESLHTDLLDQHIKFYFMFRKEETVSANLPEEVKNFIYKDTTKDGNEESFMVIQYAKPKQAESLDLDQVLDKIQTEGIDSLTPDEKKFLDDFEN